MKKSTVLFSGWLFIQTLLFVWLLGGVATGVYAVIQKLGIIEGWVFINQWLDERGLMLWLMISAFPVFAIGKGYGIIQRIKEV